MYSFPCPAACHFPTGPGSAQHAPHPRKQLESLGSLASGPNSRTLPGTGCLEASILYFLVPMVLIRMGPKVPKLPFWGQGGPGVGDLGATHTCLRKGRLAQTQAVPQRLQRLQQA